MVGRCRLLVLGLVFGALTSLTPSAAGAGSGGDPCRAGLLDSLPPQLGVPGCDVHPSAAGRAVLARAVLNVI